MTRFMAGALPITVPCLVPFKKCSGGEMKLWSSMVHKGSSSAPIEHALFDCLRAFGSDEMFPTLCAGFKTVA